MADWTECPNCGADVKADWVYPNGIPARLAGDNSHYKKPRYSDYHFTECRGSFQSGLAVAFGIMGMAEAIYFRCLPPFDFSDSTGLDDEGNPWFSVGRSKYE